MEYVKRTGITGLEEDAVFVVVPLSEPGILSVCASMEEARRCRRELLRDVPHIGEIEILPRWIHDGRDG